MVRVSTLRDVHLFAYTCAVPRLHRDVLYELACVGDLPLAEPSSFTSSLKRGWESDTSASIFHATSTEDFSPDTPRQFAGSQRVRYNNTPASPLQNTIGMAPHHQSGQEIAKSTPQIHQWRSTSTSIGPPTDLPAHYGPGAGPSTAPDMPHASKLSSPSEWDAIDRDTSIHPSSQLATNRYEGYNSNDSFSLQHLRVNDVTGAAPMIYERSTTDASDTAHVLNAFAPLFSGFFDAGGGDGDSNQEYTNTAGRGTAMEAPDVDEMVNLWTSIPSGFEYVFFSFHFDIFWFFDSQPGRRMHDC